MVLTAPLLAVGTARLREGAVTVEPLFRSGTGMAGRPRTSGRVRPAGRCVDPAVPARSPPPVRPSPSEPAAASPGRGRGHKLGQWPGLPAHRIRSAEQGAP